MLDKLKKYYIYHKDYFLYGLILLIILIILIILYLLERYIIYNIIYYLLVLFHINLFSLKIETIFLSIYLQIIFARLIILSIIFPQGGFFKKYIVFTEFCSYISLIQDFIIICAKQIDSNNITGLEENIKKLNKFTTKNDKIKKDSNYIEKNIEHITQIFHNYKNKNEKDNKIKLKQSFKKFYEELEKINNISFLELLFKFKYEESLILMESYMLNYFQTHTIEKINISKNFDIYLLSPKNITKYNNILAIFCNQNELCCEFYPFYPDNIYYYLNELNCSIILWNYTGFGLRKGFTAFGNINKDVKILSKYIKDKFNKYKIVVHGCSIGGYSSIILAQNLSELNAVLISDRTFGDIRDIVKTLDYYNILSIIYNILFPKWYFKYRNIENYINLPANKKIILFDANDEVIPYDPSSLVFSLTNKYFNNEVKHVLFKYENYFSNIKNNSKDILGEINRLFLKEEFSDENSSVFIKKLYKNIKSNNIEKFLMFFIIFSYPFNKYKEIYIETNKINDNYINTPYIIKNIVEKNKNIFTDKLIEFISLVNFLFIKFNLNCDLSDDNILKFNYNDTDKIFSIKNNRIEELKKYLGFTHRIKCGHNGKLSKQDFDIIIKFIEKNKFI